MFYKYFDQQIVLKTHKALSKFHVQLSNYSSLSNLIKFNKEETDKILEIVNKTTSDELINYDISKVRSKKMVNYRLKHGEFQNLEDILHIDGFGIKILEKFGKSILNNEIPKSENSLKDVIAKQSGKFTIPPVNDEIRNKCKSCLSLHIGMSSVTWSRIELNPSMRPCELTHWQHSDILYKKLHINELIQRCLYLDHNIPSADCYIFENPQIAQPGTPGNADQVNINIQKSQIFAILGYSLFKRNCKMLNEDELTKSFEQNNIIENKPEHSNIFYMKRFLPARLFNTLVGTERVSTEQIILELLRTHYNLEDKSENFNEKDENIEQIKGNISIPLNLRKIYNISDGYQREFLGQSLLLGLTFIRLAILKCPNSIGKISTRSNL